MYRCTICLKNKSNTVSQVLLQLSCLRMFIFLFKVVHFQSKQISHIMSCRNLSLFLVYVQLCFLAMWTLMNRITLWCIIFYKHAICKVSFCYKIIRQRLNRREIYEKWTSWQTDRRKVYLRLSELTVFRYFPLHKHALLGHSNKKLPQKVSGQQKM